MKRRGVYQKGVGTQPPATLGHGSAVNAIVLIGDPWAVPTAIKLHACGALTRSLSLPVLTRPPSRSGYCPAPAALVFAFHFGTLTPFTSSHTASSSPPGNINISSTSEA